MSESMELDPGDKPHIFLYSTGKDLTAFRLFSRLPQHLRKHIYTLASPPPRTHFLEIYAYTPSPCNAHIRYIPRLPALFHATSESRKAIIDAQGGEVINLLTPQKDEHWVWDKKRRMRVKIPSKLGYFYFNFDHDILFLSSRFANSDLATETFRLRALEDALSFCYLSRLKRIVVTYSGSDDYSQIAQSMRWLDDIETLYIAMMDWWSNRMVKRLLREGQPAVGTISGKILQVLSDAEGEETEDEEEADDAREDRKMTRERRRVVEVELRLDE